MNSLSSGMMVAFGVTRLNLGNHEPNAHAFTCARVNEGRAESLRVSPSVSMLISKRKRIFVVGIVQRQG